MLRFHANLSTFGVTAGRFCGPFYLHVYRGQQANFRWHVHLRIGRDTFAPVVPRRGYVRTWCW